WLLVFIGLFFVIFFFFFFQAEDGIRDRNVTGVQTCALPIFIAFLLPGNKTLPVVDLISLPFMVESIVAITDGNILKVIANGIVWFSLGLYAASWLGSIYI